MHTSTNSYGTVMFDRTFRSYFGSDLRLGRACLRARPLNENTKQVHEPYTGLVPHHRFRIYIRYW